MMIRNLGAVISGSPPPAKYDGYTSCPLVTGKSSCILAEFDFQVSNKNKKNLLFCKNPTSGKFIGSTPAP